MNDIKYIELKTGYNHNGPAWIGQVEFSKSKQTIYFNNQAFKKIKGQGVLGNYYDLASGNEYWISGIKKNEQNRHKNSSGIIGVEDEIVNQYLKYIGRKNLEKSLYKIVEVLKTDRNKFIEIENVSYNN